MDGYGWGKGGDVTRRDDLFGWWDREDILGYHSSELKM